MMSSKYYVYGGGRWRELDAASGRVSGWSGARLCVARRGRLVVQRGAARRRLLAALRALAAGRPSAARDGPRLALARRPLDSVKPSRRPRPRSRCRCRCCCHHNNNSCKSPPAAPAAASAAPTAARSLTSDACIQTAPPASPPPRPRLAFPPSTTTTTTTATVHNTPRARNTSTPVKKRNTATSPSKRRNSSTSWKHDESSSDSTEPPVNNTKTSSTKKTNLSLKRKHPWSNSDTSDTSDISKSEISISQSILKKDFNAKFLRPRKSVRRDSPSRASLSQDRQPRIRTRVIPGKVIHISSDGENKDPTVNYRSLKNTQDTETEEERTKRSKSIELFTQKYQTFQEKIDIYRELVISEDDVDILRRFMIKNDPRFDLYRYDNDDTYKARLFYSINPLVSMERCPRIVSMLEGREGLSLQQFASQLGLRSVSDGVSSRASPRKRRPPAYVPCSQDDTDSEDKENLETAIRRSLRHNASKLKDKPERERRNKVEDTQNQGDREKDNNVSKMTEVTVNIERLKDGSRLRGSRMSKDNIQRNNQSDNLKRKTNESVDDTELNVERRKRQRKLQEHQDPNTENHVNQVHNKNDVKTSVLSNDMVKKEVKGARPVVPIPSTVNDFRSKEYSNLEDHAIVAWISQGDRANLVNGNRVWRLLEQSFEELAGRARSWHSLRNRYLRNLLPTLGRLELPAEQQARLRAAAVQGEIKGLKAPPRRNSIYGEPVRGAASRRPGAGAALEPSPPPRRSESDRRTPPTAPRPRPRAARTPRYSEVTRQFAARHAVSSSSEFEPPKSPKSTLKSAKTTPKSPKSSVKSPRVRPRSPESRGPGPRSRTRKLYNPNKL